MSALLEVDDVVKRFGGVAAVDGVSFDLEEGAILGLIGPNGSGKTTLLSVLAGTHDATSGRVLLNGEVVSGRGAHRSVRSGIARTFQTTRLFPSWTLQQSLALARGESGRTEQRVGAQEIADTLGLGPYLPHQCASLTSAQQRLAMIAIALATSPSLLLLDEPAVGMDTDEALTLADAVRRIRTEWRVGIVVVDHNMHFLMPLADSVMVMASGTVLASGTPAEVRADQAVIASYLGA